MKLCKNTHRRRIISSSSSFVHPFELNRNNDWTVTAMNTDTQTYLWTRIRWIHFELIDHFSDYLFFSSLLYPRLLVVHDGWDCDEYTNWVPGPKKREWNTNNFEEPNVIQMWHKKGIIFNCQSQRLKGQLNQACWIPRISDWMTTTIIFCDNRGGDGDD